MNTLRISLLGADGRMGEAISAAVQSNTDLTMSRDAIREVHLMRRSPQET